MAVFAGLCAISGARFGQAARLPELTGSRAEAHRYAALCRDLAGGQATAAVRQIDSRPKNAVYADFKDWASALVGDVAMIYIGTHAFQGNRGLIFQFEDSIASCREYSGLALRDFYDVISSLKIHFYIVVDCCRDILEDCDLLVDDYHPPNVTVIYACPFGHKTLDWRAGAASGLRAAICAQLKGGASELSFADAIASVEAEADRKRDKVVVVGRAAPGKVAVAAIDVGRHVVGKKIIGVELRSDRISADRMPGIIANIQFIIATMRPFEGIDQVNYEQIPMTDSIRIWATSDFTKSFYDLIVRCIQATKVSSVECFFEDGSSSSIDDYLRRLEFSRLPEHRDTRLRTIRGVQHLAILSSNSVIFNCADCDATPMPIQFSNEGLFEFLAAME